MEALDKAIANVYSLLIATTVHIQCANMPCKFWGFRPQLD